MQFPVEIWIHRPILTETLSSLLSCPIKWSACLLPTRHPIGAVQSITLTSGGALVGEFPPRNDCVITNEVSFFWVDTRKCVQREKMEESLREVGRLVPTTLDPDAGGRPSIAFVLNPGLELDACLANVGLSVAVLRRYDSSFCLLLSLDSFPILCDEYLRRLLRSRLMETNPLCPAPNFKNVARSRPLHTRISGKISSPMSVSSGDRPLIDRRLCSRCTISRKETQPPAKCRCTQTLSSGSRANPFSLQLTRPTINPVTKLCCLISHTSWSGLKHGNEQREALESSVSTLSQIRRALQRVTLPHRRGNVG